MTSQIQPHLNRFADWLRETDDHALYHLGVLVEVELASRAGGEITPEERRGLAGKLERWRYQHLNQHADELDTRDQEFVDSLDVVAQPTWLAMNHDLRARLAMPFSTRPWNRDQSAKRLHCCTRGPRSASSKKRLARSRVERLLRISCTRLGQSCFTRLCMCRVIASITVPIVVFSFPRRSSEGTWTWRK